MRYQVDYVYGDISDIESGVVILEADLPEDASHAEENSIFKPLITQKTGHVDVKIMSYSEMR